MSDEQRTKDPVANAIAALQRLSGNANVIASHAFLRMHGETVMRVLQAAAEPRDIRWRLPVITQEMVEDWIQERASLIEIDADGKYQWTQDAVDIACMFKGSYSVPYDDGRPGRPAVETSATPSEWTPLDVDGRPIKSTDKGAATP